MADLKPYHIPIAQASTSSSAAQPQGLTDQYAQADRAHNVHHDPHKQSRAPPTYSQQDDSTLLDRAASPLQPQVVIVPTTSALGFQKGYLGADGERAAIEGELQVKGSTAGRWGRVCVRPCFSLCTS